jgi:phosphonate transport system permease protein
LAEASLLPERPFPVSRRGRLLVGIALAATLSWGVLGLSPAGLVPNRGGLEMLRMFLHGAISPAWSYEAESVPAGTTPLPLKVLSAMRTTVVFAAAGMSLSLVIGLVLGFLGASSWWSDEPCRAGSVLSRLRCYVMPVTYSVVRVVIALMRSVHELLWAVLFLAAFGLNSLSAVIAIAIPYGGTLAKVFSEMLDEAPRDSARSLRVIGARPLQVFAFGLLPRALPDTAAYSFYRFECAVRSSAILGFFGYPTLGYYLRLSAENQHYREVWSYLYGLLMIILLLELWSLLLRRRLVVR